MLTNDATISQWNITAMKWINSTYGIPGGSDSKESACNAGDPGSIPGLGRSPGEGHGYPCQYSCLENPMDRGAWRATLHGVPRVTARYWTKEATHKKIFPFKLNNRLKKKKKQNTAEEKVLGETIKLWPLKTHHKAHLQLMVWHWGISK